MSFNEQGSPGWHSDRACKVTSSRLKEALRMSEPYAKEIREELAGIIRPEVYAKPLAHGKLFEPRAIAAYSLMKGVIVTPCGFIQSKIDYFGGSPDGLIDDSGIIEAKCPTDIDRHYTFPHVVQTDHMPQIQGNLLATEREWCDAISFVPSLPIGKDLVIVRVYRDEKYLTMVRRKLPIFWDIVTNEKPIEIEIPQLF